MGTRGLSRWLVALGSVAGWGLVLPPAYAATKSVTCHDGKAVLQPAIDSLKPGDLLRVSGSCRENVVVRQETGRVTIDGQGSASLSPQDPAQPTVVIEGRDVTIRQFRLTDGSAAVVIRRGGVAIVDGNVIEGNLTDGVDVLQGSVATIINNTIQSTGAVIKGLVFGDGVFVAQSSTAYIGFVQADVFGEPVAAPNVIRNNRSTGIVVTMNSFARIANNTIESNAFGGVSVTEASSARIGYVSGNDLAASPNTIQGNGGAGVLVARSSTARIFGNTITGNAGDGVQVREAAQASVASNVIDANNGHGVSVHQSSGINLGSDSGTRFSQLPNSTTTPNGGFGLMCELGGYADGRLGTLTGSRGPTSFDGTCIDSLIP